MIGSERHYLHDAGASDETAHRFGHQWAADAGPAYVLGHDEPADMVDRGLRGEEQAAEQMGVHVCGCHEGGAPADAPVERRLKARITGHGAEPVLDLRRERDEPGSVMFACSPDEHRDILPVRSDG
jgi:hypothetical protein